MSELQGIDVSNWQGRVNWQEVKNAGKDFALCKATEGASFVDPTFTRNFHVSAQRGLLRGCYHFASLGDPRAEAEWFAERAGAYLRRGDWAMLDIETPGRGVADWVLAWCQRSWQLTGAKPVIYSYLSYIQAFLADARLATYPLIVADYSDVAPSVPSPWPVMTGWQYTDAGTVPGIAGAVDLDVIYGDRGTWMKLGKQ